MINYNEGYLWMGGARMSRQTKDEVCVLAAAGMKMKKALSGRKENQLFIG